MSKTALPQMPQYSQVFNVDKGSLSDKIYWLYVRYYGAWNPDGSQEPVGDGSVYWPDITLTDVNGKSETLLPADIFDGGGLTLFSKYATVITYPVYPKQDVAQVLTVSGFFEQTGYMSLSLYCSSPDVSHVFSEQHYRGDELPVMDGGLNPFIKGNPSVFAYERPAPTSLTHLSGKYGQGLKNTFKVHNGYLSVAGNKLGELNADEVIDFYRPSNESFYNGEYGFQESVASDGCSADYLGALNLLASEKQYFILKMKVPTTFIHDDNPETTYAGYDLDPPFPDSFCILS